ncbi:hypothetical protein [Xanthomonas sacchari]|uniref:hypothetical protein n=1 Tax=Xanthomonas sacchari TaxID=56458 RepID=UPI0027D76F69|nr:hypothetical protein [Xanthomonas sacchari]
MNYLDECDKHLSGHEQQFCSDLGVKMLAELAADNDALLRVESGHAYSPLRAMVELVSSDSETYEFSGLRP